MNANFKDLEGKILSKIEGSVGSDSLHFYINDKLAYYLFHGQECCETVEIVDIEGDLSDLINSPILLAEEVTHEGTPDNLPVQLKNDFTDSSDTWTFYKLSTIKGSVTIRWCGSSNGYYSESVSFEKYGEEND